MQIYDLKGGEINIKLGFFYDYRFGNRSISFLYKKLPNIQQKGDKPSSLKEKFDNDMRNLYI